MGGAANKIILGCQAFGLLSEQGVAKNSPRGVRGAQRDRQRGQWVWEETLERQPKWPLKVRTEASGKKPRIWVPLLLQTMSGLQSESSTELGF